MNKKIVVIGGVAGGMAAAARLRRLSEEYDITVIERGPYVSFANCGLPYYIGGVIQERSRLFVKTSKDLSEWFNIKIKTNTEAVKIDRETKKVIARDLKTNESITFEYDKLVLSPGAEPFIPEIPGIKHPNIFKLRNIEDVDNIKNAVNTLSPAKAIIIGAGFIGLEMAENLRHLGIDVSVVELDKQVMPPIDPEISYFIHQILALNEVKLYLGNTVEKFEEVKGKLVATLNNGNTINADIVIVSIGVVPDTALAKEAMLDTGIKGAILVNDKLETSDHNIYAAGDAVQIKERIAGKDALIPLAGPANRQGRIIAANIAGLNKTYPGTLGTSICKVFDLTVASTGLNEKNLKKNNINYIKTYIHPFDHANYYKEACPLTIKLLFSPENGTLFGAQAVGNKGVDKRIDVIATAIQAGLKVSDLEDLELAYAPPYNSVKDPVNILGSIGSNIMQGFAETITPDELPYIDPEKTVIINVSTYEEHNIVNIPDSICIPINELRSRLVELDKSKNIISYCQVGLRGYLAYRILTANGFKAKYLSGGVKMYKAFNEIEDIEKYRDENAKDVAESICKTDYKQESPIKANLELDACGLQCPGPIMQLKSSIEKLKENEKIKISVTDPGFIADAGAWCNKTGNKLISLSRDNGKITAIIEKKVKSVLEESSGSDHSLKTDKTIIVFSNDLDKALAAFIIANGAASMGDRVTLFFTFWGLNVLRKDIYIPAPKGLLDRMFGMMMPRGATKLSLSKMHMFGMGTGMMKYVMKNKNVHSLPELMQMARANGVRLVACTMSMDVMGIKKEELLDGIEEAGVASFLDSANSSNVNLFI